ncbi:hypothetical protein D6C79_10229 [Aureobasidium pullulans]|nr:hypothetical protein D6C79_10229 [Aureobasidium pullulans]
MTDAWFHNAIATPSPDGEGCRPEEALALKSYLRSLHHHRRMLPPNSPLQPLTFHLQANLSSISGVSSSTLLIEIPGCQKHIIDLLLKIQQLPDVEIERGAEETCAERYNRSPLHIQSWLGKKNSMNKVGTRVKGIYGREGGGASVQRWQFWKKRVEEIVKDEGVGEEIREAARETLEEMRRVDGNG